MPREVAKHQLGTESDFGAGRIWRMSASVKPEARGAIEQIAKVLAPIGVAYDPNAQGGGGSDLSQMHAKGMAALSLTQDGTYYFDWHHTPNDTLDKIDPQDLAQNVAVYAAFAYMAAQADGDFGSAPGAFAGRPRRVTSARAGLASSRRLVAADRCRPSASAATYCPMSASDLRHAERLAAHGDRHRHQDLLLHAADAGATGTLPAAVVDDPHGVLRADVRHREIGHHRLPVMAPSSTVVCIIAALSNGLAGVGLQRRIVQHARRAGACWRRHPSPASRASGRHAADHRVHWSWRHGPDLPLRMEQPA